MLDRRRFISGYFAATALIWAFSFPMSSSLSLEGAVNVSIDDQFREAIAHVASLRETNRSTAIDVAYLFKDLTDKHSLSEFRAYLGERYKFTRAKDVYGNAEFVDLDEKQLKLFDRRFLWLDRLRIGFGYTADWQSISSVFAVLGNDQL
jgi:hypothetical protein